MTKKSTIYIFGNPLLEYDNLPILFKPALEEKFPDIEFIIQDPNENLHPEDKALTIIDTVEGIEKIEIITKIEQIQTAQTCSVHDFDLGMNLKLLQKLGMLEKITIFGVPMDGDKNILLGELIEKIYSSDNSVGIK